MKSTLLKLSCSFVVSLLFTLDMLSHLNAKPLLGHDPSTEIKQNYV
jgi:hypothetical protein